jgi:hypothetical protein
VRRLAGGLIGLLLWGGVGRAAGKPRPTAKLDPSIIWAGASGGVVVRWMLDDIVVHQGGEETAVKFSVRAAAEQAWKTATAGETRNCTEDRRIQIASMVGPILTLAIEVEGNCVGAPHPYASRRWATLDVARIDRGRPTPMRLTALIPEEELLSRLVRDPLVVKAIADRPAPESMKDLFALLADHPIIVGGCAFEFGENELSAFAIYGLSGGDRVAVRIALPDRDPSCRGQKVQLGLDVPTPERLRAAVVQAAGGRAGFLLRDLDRMGRGKQTTFRLSTTAPPAEAPAAPLVE